MGQRNSGLQRSSSRFFTLSYTLNSIVAHPRGAFNNARNVVLNQPTFIDGNHPNDKDCKSQLLGFEDTSANERAAMELLLSRTIHGAEYDSFE